ncbi:MAG: hypothetical protein ACRCW7_07460 [Cetobacterium sp.]
MRNKNMEDFNDEMVKIFYGVDFKKFENREAKRIIQEVSEKNKKIIQEKDALILKIKRLENELSKKENLNYEKIFKDFQSRFFYSSEDAVKSLATAEYLFLNEGNKIDYSGVFLNYLKAFEIEVRNRLDKSNKMTFGKLLNRLKAISELKTFIAILEKIDILQTRNKGVHNKLISKLECGKLRKLLLEERWFDRVNQILNDLENNKPIIITKMLEIQELEGFEMYSGKKYLCFATKEGLYVLSQTNLELGNKKISGEIVNIYGIDYIKS